jgi:hypothetical protein
MTSEIPERNAVLERISQVLSSFLFRMCAAKMFIFYYRVLKAQSRLC